MESLNEILSLMKRIDPQYRKYMNVVSILNEDKRTVQADDKCRSIIKNFFGNVSNDYIESILLKIKNVFYHDSSLRSSSLMRLEPLICRMALENGFAQNNQNNAVIQRLSNILNQLYTLSKLNKINVSNISLDMSFDEFNKTYGKFLDDYNEQENNALNNKEYVKNEDYEIIGPIDYETAHYYGNFSCPASLICYTQDKDTWEHYIKDGENTCYLILSKNFKKIKPKHDDETENPYDTYGLSMIFVFVDSTGNISYCNTRWNHQANYSYKNSCDHALSKSDISNIIGMNFNQVFKPLHTENDNLGDIEKRLNNGESPYNIFDYVSDVEEGFACVVIDKKCNFINTYGQLLSKKWYDNVEGFCNGFGKVELNDQYNFIKKDGTLLSEYWFDAIDDFDNNGFALVELNDKYFKIDTKGQLYNCDDEY